VPEESTTPDPLELTRRSVEALNRRDFDAAASSYAPNAVLKLTGMGASFEGVAAIRRFFEDFIGTFAEYQIELEEVLDLGHGVSLGVFLQQARPIGSSASVRIRFAGVGVTSQGAVARHTWYTDVDEARAAAARLAESKGQAISAENVERLLVAYARFNAGEKEPSLDDWHEDAEYVASSEDPDSDTHRGIEAIRQQFARWVIVRRGTSRSSCRARCCAPTPVSARRRAPGTPPVPHGSSSRR
jgi:ketosteroid isomerase-like protein